MHPLHLSNIDKTVKTFVVDESKTVGEIAKDIGTKLGLRNADELSLKRQQEEDDGIYCHYFSFLSIFQAFSFFCFFSFFFFLLFFFISPFSCPPNKNIKLISCSWDLVSARPHVARTRSGPLVPHLPP